MQNTQWCSMISNGKVSDRLTDLSIGGFSLQCARIDWGGNFERYSYREGTTGRLVGDID